MIEDGDDLKALDLTHDDIVHRLGQQVQRSRGRLPPRTARSAARRRLCRPSRRLDPDAKPAP